MKYDLEQSLTFLCFICKMKKKTSNTCIRAPLCTQWYDEQTVSHQLALEKMLNYWNVSKDHHDTIFTHPLRMLKIIKIDNIDCCPE